MGVLLATNLSNWGQNRVGADFILPWLQLLGQLRGHLRRLDTRAQVVTAVSFGPGRGHLVAASLEGLLTSFTSEA